MGQEMKSKLVIWGFALLAVAGLLAACEQRALAPVPTREIEQEWPIPTDKYVFIERWIEISREQWIAPYKDSAVSAFIDFPTYQFDQNSGELKPDIVPPGRWFPLEDLTELKVVYGRGTKRTGSGAGVNSQVYAVTSLPFTEPPKGDTDVLVTVEDVNAQGVVYLRRGDEQFALQPGESWTRDGKSTVEWGGVKSEISSQERISNFGVFDKSGIRVTTEVQKAIEIAMKDTSVQEEISGEGYEVGQVRQLDPSEPGVFLVTIHLGKRELPGITLAVVADVVQGYVLIISLQLRPRELTEEKKAEARRIALSDPEVLARIGDKEYEVTRIEEFSWSEGDEFFVFPAVELNIPPDRQVEGVVPWVAVDLQAKKVVEIHSTPRKPLPPNILIMNAAIRLIIYVPPILVVIAILFFILRLIWGRFRRKKKAA